MPKPFLTSLCLLSFIISIAQSGDFIAVKKKNGISVKSFYAGSSISGNLKNGAYFEGKIQVIANDTIHLLWYTIQKLPTPWGTFVYDTIGWNISKIGYKDIAYIPLPIKRNRKAKLLSSTLMIGGLGYGALNTFNSLREGEKMFSSNNKKALLLSGGLIGAGFLIHKLFVHPQLFNPRRHNIVYVSLQKIIETEQKKTF